MMTVVRGLAILDKIRERATSPLYYEDDVDFI